VAKSITIATAFDARRAAPSWLTMKNGTTTGNVERNTRRKTPAVPALSATLIGSGERHDHDHAEHDFAGALERIEHSPEANTCPPAFRPPSTAVYT
jgi:hypothetical protein